MRDIAAQIQEWYGVEVSPQLISTVTDAVMEEVRQWQNRPLESVYPLVYMDCLVVKVKENQRLRNLAVYLALGVDLDGLKELLGMWMSENEGLLIQPGHALPRYLRSIGLKGGGEGLARGLYGTVQSGDERWLYCLCGWPHMPPGSYRNRVSPYSGTAMHGAYRA